MIKTSSKPLFQFAILILFVMLSARTSLADPWYNINNEGYHDLQVDGSRMLYVTGEDAWWLEGTDIPWPENEHHIEIWYYLWVDGNLISSFMGDYEEGYWEGTKIISRDSGNPDLVPFAIQHQLSSGLHHIVFTCSMYAWDSIEEPMDAYIGPQDPGPGYTLTRDVTVP